MQHSMKIFAVNINKYLDDLAMPAEIKERAALLGKMLNIAKQQARDLLEGHSLPDADLLEKLGLELDIDPQKLLSEF